jgi:ABC-type Fe3+ transport system substrate-binding protein
MIIPHQHKYVSSALCYDTAIIMASLDDSHFLAQLESYETATICTAYNWPKSHYVVRVYIWHNIAILNRIIETYPNMLVENETKELRKI